MKDFLKMVFGSCLGVILASVVVFFIFFSMLSSAIGGLVDGFKDGKETKKVSSESVLLLDLEGELAIRLQEILSPICLMRSRRPLRSLKS